MRPSRRSGAGEPRADADAPLARDADASGSGPPRRVDLLGAPLDLLDMEQTVALVVDALETGKELEHTSVNAAKVCRIQTDLLLRDALRRSPIVTADGQAVVWAARLFGLPVPERVAGIDLFLRLLAVAEERAYSVYLLGAEPAVVKAVVERVASEHPNLRIAGARDGYWPPEEEPHVVASVAATRSDMLFVALDTPRKELFLDRYRKELGVGFVMGVGGSFDVLAGRRRRAPRWAQRAGLEWLFRLAQDPRRLAGRYLVGNTRFVALVVRGLLARRAAHRVLFVGPATSGRGGVASVMTALARAYPPPYAVEIVASTSGDSPRRKLATTAAGLVRAFVLLASGRVSLVHLHASSYWSFRRKLLFYGLARLFRRPVIWQIHCGRFERYVGSAGPLERRVVRGALARSRRVIFLSQATADRLASQLGLANTLVAVHPAVAEPLPASGERLVVSLGTISESKGSFLLLDAFARVLERVPDARLVLAGEGETDAARARAAELGLGDAVSFPGWLGEPEKAALLARAGVVAHPSYVDALPMSVVEALASGRAVVTTAVGAVPEIVRDGVDGFVVPPGDVEALAAALVRVLEDETLRQTLGAGAAEGAERFRPSVVAESVTAAYAPA